MFVTLDVFQSLMSSLNVVAFSNILDIVKTFDVFQFFKL